MEGPPTLTIGRSGSGPGRDACRRERRMCFGDAVLTEMEDGGRKHGTRMALNHSVDQVLQRTHAAAGNHGNGNAVSNGPGQCKIIALPRDRKSTRLNYSH